MSSSPITSGQIDRETMETMTVCIFLGSKVTADGDWGHEIKRRLLLGRNAMTNLDSILKIKDITLLLNMLSRLVITFLPRSKRLLISWPQSPSAVVLEPKKIKPVTVSVVSPSICHEVMGQDAMILVFWMLSFKPTFSLSSFTFIKKLLSFSSLSAIRVVSSACLHINNR